MYNITLKWQQVSLFSSLGKLGEPFENFSLPVFYNMLQDLE
jgi:hypothetical protein